MSTDAPIEWTLKPAGPNKRRRPQLVLVGARFLQKWLETERIDTSQVFFDGDLGQSLSDLRGAVRTAAGVPGFELPIARLRASMLAHIDGVISLDRDLGVGRADQPRRAAATLFAWSAAAEAANSQGTKGLSEKLCECLQRWYRDVLDPWAKEYDAEDLAQRVSRAAAPSNIRVARADQSLIVSTGSGKRFEFGYLIRQVAEQLIGEELFPGLGPCELVLDAVSRDPARSNAIDLMTVPRRLPGREESFSMVARLSAVTMPYSRGVFLKVSAIKRVWASKLPGPKRNAPFDVRAYLIAPAKPIYTVSVQRKDDRGWEFGGEYADWLNESSLALPATLEKAIARLQPDASGWWAGLPELTTLFDSVSPRTVFEGDEIELCEQVCKRLSTIVTPHIEFQNVPIRRGRSSAKIAMLRLSDLGLAGQAIDELGDEEDGEDDTNISEEDVTADEDERKNILRHREQNVAALKAIHGTTRPVLWAFCDPTLERTLIEKSVEQLFGNGVELRLEPLPANTHGLKDGLPGAKLKESARFNLRVEAWKLAAEQVKATSAARHVLICASDREGGRIEDSVNYYAGIHAMCHFGDANVHHVLPIGGGDLQRAQQNFVYRLQSALLDVFFAHSGKVFGTREFLSPLFSQHPPKYIYGVQAMRSNARAFSGEIKVSFLVLTRLHVDTGVTDVLFIYRERRVTAKTAWMPLSEGLRWLGSQRLLESDEVWLKTSAARQIRFWLGEVAKDDPRAVVLVDWSTMTSIWRGISDDDLTTAGVPRIDSGTDVASACPQMTLVRLRRGESAIDLRAEKIATFESSVRGGLGSLDPTREVYTERYGTTTKAIVKLTGSSSATGARARGHYIQSMGYRSTVQGPRGQSCYRTRQRMSERKADESQQSAEQRNRAAVFELRILDVSRKDAALPAPLEVTVMSCPADVQPDNVAIAVLGMRLGYLHYGDWTALPAPLFFKRKIEDYVIRYRSPASATGDADLEEGAEEDSALTSGSGEAPDSEPADAAAIAETGAVLEADSNYLRGVANELVGPAAAQATAPVAAARATENFQDGTHAQTDVVPPSAVAEAELIAAAAGQLSDEQLLRLVKNLAREDFALCGSNASLQRRTKYERLMQGRVRISVPVPFFVDKTCVFADTPPNDRVALRRFWRGLRDLHWVRLTDQMPSLEKFSAWVLRRLHIPQGGYSIYGSSMFPRTSLFAPIREGWKRYVAEQHAHDPDGLQVQKLSDMSMDLAELTRWAALRKDDKLIAWMIFGSAHFPFVDGVLDCVIPNVSSPIGPYTKEALYYFSDCVRAARVVINSDGSTPIPQLNFKSRTLPRNVSFIALEREEGRPGDLLEAVATDAAPDASGDVVSSDVASLLSQDGSSHGVSASNAKSADASGFVDPLRPGEADFDVRLADMRSLLETLEKEHVRINAARAAAREAEERAADRARERAAYAERWTALRDEALQMLQDMRASLPDTQTWSLLPVEKTDLALDEVAFELKRVDGLIGATRAAQDEFQVVEQRATPPGSLTPREVGRYRMQWQTALQSAHETLEAALNSLFATLKDSPVYKWTDVRVISVSDTLVHSSLDADAGLQSQAPSLDHVEPEAIEQTAHSPPLPLSETDTAPTISTCADSSLLVLGAESPDTSPVGEAGPDGGPSKQATSLEGDFSQECAAVDVRIEAEALGARERAEVVLQLLDVPAYALAEVYVAALELYHSASTVGDHALVVSAALEAIRRLRMDSAPEQPHSARLYRRFETEDDGGLQMPGCQPLAAGLGIMAAGLAEMIFPQPANSGRWAFVNYLEPRFSEQPKLQAFLERIKGLEGFPIAQDMLTIATIGARKAAESNILRMRERAKRWASDEALYKKWTQTDYRRLHAALFENEEYAIARCLGVIARGEDDKLDEAYRNARKKLDRPLATVEELAKKIDRRHGFNGVARGHIKGNIERTGQFIEDYRNAISRAKGGAAAVASNARTMLQSLYQDLIGALEFVTALDFEEPRDRMHQRLSVTALMELKRMFDCQVPEKLIDDIDQLLMLRLALGTDLRPSLWEKTDNAGNTVPAVVDPVDAAEEVESVAQLLTEEKGGIHQDWIRAQLERVSKDHLANNRFLPFHAIDRRLGRAGTKTRELKECHGALVAQLHNARQRVTHAMALGALTQSEASRMLRLVEELQQVSRSRSLGNLEEAPVATPDFPHAYSALRRLVTQPLEEKLADSKRAFLSEIEIYLQQRLAERNPPLHLQTDVERIRARAVEHSASSIRAARDMFSLLKENALPREGLEPKTSVADTYKQFVEALNRDVHSHEPLIETLIKRLRDPRAASDPEWLLILDATQRQEAASFLQAWVKTCAGAKPDDVEDGLAQFFQGLRGIPSDVVMQPSASKAQRSEFILNNGPFAGLDRAVTGVFIPPSLGSEAQYIQGIVFRNKPAEGAITQAINERAQDKPLLVMCRGTLPLEKRAELSRHHPVLLFDDHLVAHAAVHPQCRLQKLLQVALLTFYCNPYADYARPVPPEMFFGRGLQLRSLREVKTAAVLYGGRRLGKSSLLDQLQRDADARNTEAVLYLTLDRTDHGLSEDHVFLAWDAILRKLLQRHLFERPPEELPTSRQIRRWIEDEIMAGRCKAKAIYLLIDEADEVMGRDLDKRETFVSSLLSLTESVQKRCAMRFVIAGLHNLTRMASEENSPFGKFESIALKPFWSSEDIQRGVELIRVPLEGLGFYFPSGKDMPLRIMAICNFYPAFIQIYCKKLTAHLYNRRNVDNPLTTITDEDLDAIEQDEEFLNDIRSKFKLNLELDKRYLAIALILADQYYRDGARALTSSDIRSLCDVVAPRLFENTRPSAYESLLEEMEILTILERVGGRFGLRTPNIAMMIGDREGVEQQLDALSVEKPIQQRSRDEVRATLVPPERFSREAPLFPLPSAWVRSIFGRTSDASVDRDLLIFVGNEISGLSEIGRLGNKGEWQIGTTATFDVGIHQSPQIARATLTRNARAVTTRATRRRWLHCVGAGWQAKDLQEYARVASILTSAPDAGSQPAGVMRLALLANMSRSYELAKEHPSGVSQGDISWRVVPVPPWNDDALYFRLQAMEKFEILSSDEARKALLYSSCGFGAEIEALCTTVRTEAQALDTKRDAEKRLAPDLDVFYRRLGVPAAIDKTGLKNAEQLLLQLDGQKRETNEDDIQDNLRTFEVSAGLFVFMQWMGLLQEAAGGTWHVPALYKRLLK